MADPVGQRFRVPPGALAPIIEQMLNAIERTHGTSDLPVVTIMWTRTFRPQARYLPPTGQEPGPGIEVSEVGATPRTSFLHEVGHLVDNVVGGLTGYASRDPASPLAPVLAALKATEAYRRLGEAAQEDRLALLLGQSAYIAGYLQSDEELWARAYAQFVVLRSGDAEARREMDAVRREPDFNRHRQWEDGDSAAVANALDRALQMIGWKR